MAALIWSPALDRVFRKEILEPLKSRSPGWPTAWLGVPYSEIQNLVLEMGRTDFQREFRHPLYGTLSPQDKVDLYCFMNLRSHFYALLATFEAFGAELGPLLTSGEPPLVVDLGAGPGTGALALAEHLQGRGTFDYYPIEIAPAMRARASSLFAAVKGAQGARSALGEYLPSASPKRWIFVASYFFASQTLDIRWVVDLVRKAMAACEEVFFVYTNSVDARAGQKWQQFCGELGIIDTASAQSIEYLNSRAGGQPRPLTFMRTVHRLR